MKKLLISAIWFSLVSQLFSQGIPVSTDPSNKNIVLEEFTGYRCVNCPDGHKRAKEIYDLYPGKVVLLNIHAGSWATPQGNDPDFTTDFGQALANQSGLTGYPSGTINRHLFPNETKTALNRGYWKTYAGDILQEPSYANLGVEATINIQTRELTVTVQVYYTAFAPSLTAINVAILQDNIAGPQTGAAANPSQILESGEYNHQHMLRHFVTGQWGDNITTGSAFSYIDRVYTYTLPDSIKDIPLLLEELEIAAYLSEGRQEIVTGHTVKPKFTNFENAIDIFPFSTIASGNPSSDIVCGFTAAPIVTIKNNGGDDITDMAILYSINGSEEKGYIWTGLLEPLRKVEITLDPINYFPNSTNTLNLRTIYPNNTEDDNSSNDAVVLTFSSALDVSTNLTMTLQLDYYGSEVTWELQSSDGSVLYSGGPYPNVPDPSSNPPFPSPIVQNFTIATGDCYNFIINDSYGDGLLGSGNGFTLVDDQNITLLSDLSDYNSRAEAPFGVNAPEPDSSDVFTGIKSVNATDVASVSIYPNPTKGQISLQLNSNISSNALITLNDIAGKQIMSQEFELNIGENNRTLNFNSIQAGMYFLNIQLGDSHLVERLVISK